MARFRSARSSEEERELFKKFTPPSTRYATKWAIKVFNEWRGAREVKEVETNDVGFGIDDGSSIQSLCIPLQEMDAVSLAFWLRKFVGEVANANGERYPARTLYCLICGLNRFLSDVKGTDTINILDKKDRR